MNGDEQLLENGDSETPKLGTIETFCVLKV